MSDTMLTADGFKPIDAEHTEKQITTLAENRFRLIALARREVQTTDKDDIRGLTFLGMVAMIDPLRSDAFEALQRCQQGGIEVAMITGDHPSTAKAIAIELGLCGD